MKHLLLSVLLTVAAAGAGADERYVGVFVGSQHLGSDDFNNFNPGLTYGRRWDAGTGGAEWHAEGGVFYNSYREVSPIFVAGLSTRVAQVGPGEVRVGASIGTAYYKELSEILEDKYDVPNVGGFLPLAVLTGAYRVGRTEYRLNLSPVGDDVNGVLNFSFAVGF